MKESEIKEMRKDYDEENAKFKKLIELENNPLIIEYNNLKDDLEDRYGDFFNDTDITNITKYIENYYQEEYDVGIYLYEGTYKNVSYVRNGKVIYTSYIGKECPRDSKDAVIRKYINLETGKEKVAGIVNDNNHENIYFVKHYGTVEDFEKNNIVLDAEGYSYSELKELREKYLKEVIYDSQENAVVHIQKKLSRM